MSVLDSKSLKAAAIGGTGATVVSGATDLNSSAVIITATAATAVVTGYIAR